MAEDEDTRTCRKSKPDCLKQNNSEYLIKFPLKGNISMLQVCTSIHVKLC